MSRPVILLLTTSLDGFIAAPDGAVDWLLAPPQPVPPAYERLMDSIDTLVMGSETYRVSLELLGGTDIFGGKRVMVFSSCDALPPLKGVEQVREPAASAVRSLKAEPGGTIWLFGGGRLATSLSDAGLVDEYRIYVQPILLGDGIPLWRSPHARTELALVAASDWGGGMAELVYRRASDAS